MSKVLVGDEPVRIGALIGKGGEGEVFKLDCRPATALKLYKPEKRREREEKVRAMVAQNLATRSQLVAYPTDIARDREGRFLGFLMHLVSGYRPVHEMYTPKSRLRHFPNADYRLVVRAATNVARAVGQVHQTGCTIGDLNHSGILIAQDATVALIDADSFQFSVNGKIFPCVVGVPDFTPPELQGLNLSRVTRTVEHDNFGLAVALFQLLFMGRHPYSGRYNGPDISLGEAIAQNRFAFSIARRSATQTTPPPASPTLDMFPQPIQEGFERAFGPDPRSRPSAGEWVSKLTMLERNLQSCRHVRSHYYPNTSKECIWCHLAPMVGRDLFPDASPALEVSEGDDPDIERILAAILAFELPTASTLLPSAGDIYGPSPALKRARAKNQWRPLARWLAVAVAVIGFIATPPLLVIWLVVGALGWGLFRTPPIDAESFHETYRKANEEVQAALDEFTHRRGLSEILLVKQTIDEDAKKYRTIDYLLGSELDKLRSSKEKRHREYYLDQFPVRNADIPGIGPAKTSTLISFGVETAADVDRDRILTIPGFGEALTGRLVNWRRNLEKGFRYNTSYSARDAAAERALQNDFARRKAKLAHSIRAGWNSIRTLKPRLDAAIASARTDSALLRAVRSRAQAKYDLKELGEQVPPSSVRLRVPPQSPGAPRRAAAAQPATPTSTSATARSASRPLAAQGPRCPRCSSQMTRRTSKYGPFWGCTRYPRCKGKRRI